MSTTRHRYAGGCPDQLQPDARDPTCPACRSAATGVACPTCGEGVGDPCSWLHGALAGFATAPAPHAARLRAVRRLEEALVDG